MPEEADSLELYNLNKDPEEKRNLMTVICTLLQIETFLLLTSSPCDWLLWKEEAPARWKIAITPEEEVARNDLCERPPNFVCPCRRTKWDSLHGVVQRVRSPDQVSCKGQRPVELLLV